MSVRLFLLWLCFLAAPVAADSNAPLPSIAENASELEAKSDFDAKAALKASQDAIDTQVSDYRFMTSTGKLLSFADLRGKPLVLSLIYTSCFHTCPQTIQHLDKVIEKTKEAVGDDSFNVALIGFDVDIDEPGAMRNFGRKQGVNGEGWHLLSADRETIDPLMKELGFVYVPSPRGYDHLIQASILDAEGRIYRQIYGEVFDTQLLVEPMMELVFKRPTPNESVLDDLFNRVRFFCTTYDPRNDAYRFDYSLFLSMIIGASVILSAIWFMIHETVKRNRLRRS